MRSSTRAVVIAMVMFALVLSPRSAHAILYNPCVNRDSCCSGVPVLIQYVLGSGGPLAIMTHQPTGDNNGTSITAFKLSPPVPIENANWPGLTRYHGPSDSWDSANLGDIFGICLDSHGNIFVTATAMYLKQYGPGGAGAVYRIDSGTGAITTFVSLPTATSASLGNIGYDCVHEQFFVTNLEDGKIYRIAPVSPNAATGSVLSTFDPGAPDDGIPGLAPPGQRLFGIHVKGGRVYYAVWANSVGSSIGGVNSIRSVGLLGNGAFDVPSDREELLLPVFDFVTHTSNPVTDIEFSGRGDFLYAAERGLDLTLVNYPHQSRLLQFACESSTDIPFWAPGNVFKLGDVFKNYLGNNCAGGVAVDVQPYDGPKPPDTAPTGTAGSRGRIWATADAIHFHTKVPIELIYGMQGLRPTGGNIATSLLVDTNGNLTTNAGLVKGSFGDVVIPCAANWPDTFKITGTKYQDLDRDGIHDAGEPGLGSWTIHVSGGESRSTVSDGSGAYLLDQVPLGDCWVWETPKAGWVQTGPASGGYGFSQVLPLPVLGLDFGNVACLTDSALVPPSGLRRWWPLDESFSPAHDLVGVRNGQWFGPTPTPGYVGGALNFGSGAPYVEAAAGSWGELSAGTLSVLAWVQTSGSHPVRTLVESSSGAKVAYRLYLANGLLHFLVGNGTSIADIAWGSGPLFDDGAWHLVGASVNLNAGAARLFGDGLSLTSSVPLLAGGFPSYPIRLGAARSNLSTGLVGKLDEVLIYGREISSSEVSAVYLAGHNGIRKRRCSVSRLTSFSSTSDVVTSCFAICNSDWTSASHTYRWTLGGDGPVPGQGSFFPNSGTLTIPAGQCQTVCVSAKRPTGLLQPPFESSPIASVGQWVTVLDVVTGRCITCNSLAVARATTTGGSPGGTGVGHLIAGGTGNTSFLIANNDSVTRSIPYRIVARESGSDSASTRLGLNGQAPGVWVSGSVNVASADTAEIPVSLAYPSNDGGLPGDEVVLQIDESGLGAWADMAAVPVVVDLPQSVSVPTAGTSPAPAALRAGPNPFVSSAEVRFTLPEASHVQLDVVDLAGRRVRRLLDEPRGPGEFSARWDGRDAQGRLVPAGVYFLRLRSGDAELARRLVRLE